MRTLLLDVDQQARTRARGLEGNGRLPKGFYDKHYGLLPHEEREKRLLATALLLAEDVATFTGIVNGGKVPAVWYKRRLRELLRR